MSREEKLHFNSSQIAGYRAQLVGAVNSCTDGAYAQLDLRSAQQIVLILDQAMRMERILEGPKT